MKKTKKKKNEKQKHKWNARKPSAWKFVSCGFLLEDYFEDPSTAFDDRGYLMRIIILMK